MHVHCTVWMNNEVDDERKERKAGALPFIHLQNHSHSVIGELFIWNISIENSSKKVIKRNDGYNRMRASNKVEEKCHNKAEQWIFVVVVLYCFVVVVAVDFFFVSHKDSSISHLIRHTINNSEVMSNSQITKSDKRYQVLSIVLHTL